MLEIIPKNKDPVRFEFEHGERAGEIYTGTTHFCNSPVCPCKDITFTFRSKKSNSSYQFKFDAINCEVNNNGTADSYNRNFAKSFSDNITDEEANTIYSYFLQHKAELIKNAPLDEIEVDFPIDDIEQNGTLVTYEDVFPYPTPIVTTVNDETFIAIAQYCVLPKCKCTDIYLNLIPHSNEEDSRDATVSINYKTKKIDIVEKSDLTSEEVLKIAKSILTKDNINAFAHRHQQLQKLYKLHKKKNQSIIQKNVANRVGRNDPCPCGSGKKHKKCCLK